MINDSTPLYQQVKEEVLRKIKNGLFQPGDKLPTELQLSNQLHVSRITVSKALNELREEGILVSYRGKGTFIQSSTQESRVLTPHTDVREIALIFPDILDTFAISMLNGIQSVFPREKYICHIFQSGTAAFENDLLHYCREKNISGAILFPREDTFHSAELLDMQAENYPFVLIDRRIPQIKCSYCVGDHEAIGALCVNYLHKLGHVHIAFATTADENTNSVQLRITGVRQEIARLNMPASSLSILKNIDVDKNMEPYQKPFRDIIAKNKITAFITSGRNCCLFLYQILKALKLVVPNDISLLSIDNPQLNSMGMEYFTYVDQSEFIIGKEAGTILRRKLEQYDNSTYQKVILPRLVLHQSTAAPVQ